MADFRKARDSVVQILTTARRLQQKIIKTKVVLRLQMAKFQQVQGTRFRHVSCHVSEKLGVRKRMTAPCRGYLG